MSKTYRAAIEEGRLLVVSPVSQKISRVDEQSALVRNRFILENSDRVVFAALDPNGALTKILSEVKRKRSISFTIL